MRLWEVEVTATVYVWAANRTSAESIATTHVDDCQPFSDATEILPGSATDANWSDCEPFGTAPDGYEGLTVDEITDKWDDPDNEAFVPDMHTLPLPGV